MVSILSFKMGYASVWAAFVTRSDDALPGSEQEAEEEKQAGRLLQD